MEHRWIEICDLLLTDVIHCCVHPKTCETGSKANTMMAQADCAEKAAREKAQEALEEKQTGQQGTLKERRKRKKSESKKTLVAPGERKKSRGRREE